jgi:type IV pilus assembly protein PilA
MKIQRSTKGFTLVEIMIVVVIIGLLAAMAIPAFTKVRQNSRRSALINDARQLGSAAQQYFMENNTTTVSVTLGADGSVTGDLSAYVKQVGRATAPTSAFNIVADSTFALSHPLVLGGPTGTGGLGTAVNFTAEGQLYTQ